MFQIPRRVCAGTDLVVLLEPEGVVGLAGKEILVKLVRHETTVIYQGGITYSKFFGTQNVQCAQNVQCVHTGKYSETVSEKKVVVDQNLTSVSLFVDGDAPHTVSLPEKADIKYSLEIRGPTDVFKAIEAPMLVVPLSSTESGAVSPLTDTEDLVMVSCWCCSKGSCTVSVEGPRNVFKAGDCADFNICFTGSGVRNFESAIVSIGNSFHVESTGAVQVVPVRDCLRNEAAQRITNVRAGKQYKISLVVPEACTRSTSGKIIKVESSIRVVIEFGLGWLRTIDFPCLFSV